MPTVPSIADVNRIADYTPASPTTAFAFNYPMFGNSNNEAKADLVVVVDGTALDSGEYIFTGTVIAGVSGMYDGGTVTLDTAVEDVRVIIYSYRLPRRVGYFIEGAGLKWTTLDRLMDENIAMARDASMLSQRAIKFPIEDLVDGIKTETPSVEDRGGKAAGYNLLGKPIVSDHSLEQIDEAVATVLAGFAEAIWIERELIANEAITADDFFLLINKGSNSQHALPAGATQRLFVLFNNTDFTSTIQGTFFGGETEQKLGVIGQVMVLYARQGTYYVLYNAVP